MRKLAFLLVLALIGTAAAQLIGGLGATDSGGASPSADSSTSQVVVVAPETPVEPAKPAEVAVRGVISRSVLIPADPVYPVDKVTEKPGENLSIDYGGKALTGPEDAAVKAKYKPDNFFPKLISSDDSCYPDCTAVFQVTNPTGYNLNVSDLIVETYDKGFGPTDAIGGYSMELATSTGDSAVYYIRPNSTRTVTVRAVKARNDDVEWVPVLRLTRADYPGLEVEAVGIRQLRYALWKKGAEPTPSYAGKAKVILHMDDASGNPVDSSGNSINPVARGTFTYGVTGVLGNSIKLPGGANAIVFQDSPAGNTSVWGDYNGHMSLSIWLNPGYTVLNSNTKGSDLFFSRYSTGSYFSYAGILNSTGKVYFKICEDFNCATDGTSALSTSVIPANLWTHVVLVYSNNTTPNLKIYINGTLENSSNGAYSPNGQNPSQGSFSNTTIGGFFTSAIQGFNGTIDETWLYTNYALSASEVADLYAFTSPIVGYHLEADGTDFSGNAKTLTGVGTPTYVASVFGNGAKFDGLTQHMATVANCMPMTANTPLSFVGWVNPASNKTASNEMVIAYVGSKYLAGSKVLVEINRTNLAFMYGNQTTLATSTQRASLGSYTHVGIVFNGTHVLGYFNGTYDTSVAVSTSLNDGYFVLGNTTLTSPVNGTLDEWLVYGRALTASEITNLYEAGITQLNITSPANASTQYSTATTSQVNVTAIIGFANMTVASNITYTNCTGGIHIARNNTGAEFNTTWFQLTNLNSTHFSILDFSAKTAGINNNFTLTACGGNGIISCATQTDNVNLWGNLTVNFYNATPADINTFNTFGSGLTLWYNFTGPTGNLSSLTLYYGSNVTDCHIRVNTTCLQAGNANASLTANQTSTPAAQFIVNDNNVYPSNWNFNESKQNTMFTAAAATLTTPTSFLADIYYNISTDQYQMLEAMVNATGGGVVVGYFCNGTWIDAKANPVTSSACGVFTSKPLNIPWNHTDYRAGVLNNVSDQLFSLGANTTTHSLEGIPYLDGRGAFVWAGSNGLSTTVNVWTSNYNCRVGAAYTSTGGVTWNIQTYCVDSHINHFNGSDSFYSFAAASNNLPDTNSANSTVRFDKYDQSALPPNPPTVTNPSEGKYGVSTQQWANYSSSLSPSGNSITNYTVQVVNISLDTISTLNVSTLTVVYNFSTGGLLVGQNYFVRVKSVDNAGLSSDWGYSPNWTLTTCQPPSYKINWPIDCSETCKTTLNGFVSNISFIGNGTWELSGANIRAKSLGYTYPDYNCSIDLKPTSVLALGVS